MFHIAIFSEASVACGTDMPNIGITSFRSLGLRCSAEKVWAGVWVRVHNIYCWLAGWLAACVLFAFFLLSGHTAFGVEIDQTLRFQKDKIKVKKSAPKKLDHFIYFPHLLITSRTLFIYYPFTNCCATLITRIVEACCWQVCQDMGFAKITSLNLRDSEDQDLQKIGGINCRMADILCCKQVLIAGY